MKNQNTFEHEPNEQIRSPDTTVAPTPGNDERQPKPFSLPSRIDPQLAAVMLFTKPQMAAMLQISVRTLNALMQQGDVSYLRVKGKLVRFRAEDVIRRLKEVGMVNPPADERAEVEGPLPIALARGGGTSASQPVAKDSHEVGVRHPNAIPPDNHEQQG